MLKDQLNKLFDQLRWEFEQIEQTDDVAKRKLTHLLQQGQQVLDQPGDTDHGQHLIEQIEDTMAHFEVTHPRLTNILNEIITALSNAGI